MMVRLQGAKGNPGVSFGGEFYEADENGVVEVPAEAAAILVESFGFSTTIAEQSAEAGFTMVHKGRGVWAIQNAAGEVVASGLTKDEALTKLSELSGDDAPDLPKVEQPAEGEAAKTEPQEGNTEKPAEQSAEGGDPV